MGVDSGRAGRRGRGYYTLDYGGWRIFVANNHRNIDEQAAWMTRELAASPKRCTMAIWHRPLFTSTAKPAGVQVPGKLPRSGRCSTKAGRTWFSTATSTTMNDSPS